MQTDILRCIIHMDACSEHSRTWKFHICTLIFPDSWRGIGMLNRAAQLHFIYFSCFPPFPLLLSPPRFIFVAPTNLFQGDLQGCLTVAIDHHPRADLGGCRTGYDHIFPSAERREDPRVSVPAGARGQGFAPTMPLSCY